MALFKDGNNASKGRPKGSKNKRGKISDSLAAEALKQLENAVSKAEPWAITEVLKRLSPTLKAVTPVDSLDGEYLALKMKEISEFEARLQALEDEKQ